MGEFHSIPRCQAHLGNVSIWHDMQTVGAQWQGNGHNLQILLFHTVYTSNICAKSRCVLRPSKSDPVLSSRYLSISLITNIQHDDIQVQTTEPDFIIIKFNNEHYVHEWRGGNDTILGEVGRAMAVFGVDVSWTRDALGHSLGTPPCGPAGQWQSSGLAAKFP
jgi:hypothetical protein